MDPPLPQSLNYGLPPALSPDVRTTIQNTYANNQTAIVSPAFSPILGGADVTPCGGIQSFPIRTLRFELLSGHNSNVYMDTNETSLQFRLTTTVGTAVTALAADNTVLMNVISSGASFIEAIRIYANSVEIENITSYAEIHNMLLACTVTKGERQGGISCTGLDTNTGTGVDLSLANTAAVATNTAAVVGTTTYNFALPLMSIIGLNNTEKLFPIGSISNVVMEIDTASTLPFAGYGDGAVFNPGVVSAAIASYGTGYVATIDNFNLRTKYVDLGSLGNAVLAANPTGKIFIKGFTYMSTKINHPAGTGGVVQYPVPIRAQSVKSFFFQFQSVGGSAVATQRTPNGRFDSVNWGLLQLQLQIGSDYFPSNPYNTIHRPSEAFVGLMAAFGASSLKSFGAGFSMDEYNTYLDRDVIYAAQPLMDSSATSVVRGTRTPSYANNGKLSLAGYYTAASAIKYPSCHYLGLDMERVPTRLYNGISTKSTNPMLTMQFAAPATAAYTHTILVTALVDTVIEIDLATKSCSVHK